MKIRHARPEDDAAIREMYQQMGMDYELPDLRGMLVKTVFEDDGGKVRMAIGLRPTEEAYMFVDRSEEVSPNELWERFVCLEKKTCEAAELKAKRLQELATLVEFSPDIPLSAERCNEIAHILRSVAPVDGYCFLPPELVKPFGKRLRRLGWFRPWQAFCKILAP